MSALDYRGMSAFRGITIVYVSFVKLNSSLLAWFAICIYAILMKQKRNFDQVVYFLNLSLFFSTEGSINGSVYDTRNYIFELLYYVHVLS